MKNQIKEDIEIFSRLITDAEERAKENSDARDLTSTQINYLETIQKLGNPNITELSSSLGLKKPSVTLVVDRLIVKGCVYKTQSDEDRRSSHLHLTEVGRQINLRHDYAHASLADLVTERLDADELNLFSTLLNKIISDKR